MPKNLDKIRQKIPFAKMIYPAITLFFAIAVLFSFSKTIIFLTGNINKVFSENNPSLEEVTRFDLANYESIGKRFGWPELVATTTSAPSVPAVSTASGTVATASSSSSSIENQRALLITVEKAAINITVFSGPKKNESGDALQNSLAQAGFTGAKLNNHQLILKSTIVQFKSSNVQLAKYENEIKKIVAKKYTVQVGSNLPDSADYDVSILIGEK
jgi:hypothetical protein